MNSKVTVFIGVILIVMAAAVTFQVLEMRDYKLFDTILKSGK